MDNKLKTLLAVAALAQKAEPFDKRVSNLVEHLGGIDYLESRMIVCPECGNKRCPKANDQHNACTNSNAVGQKGSSWEHVA